jgi:hypothetical protein
VVEPAAVAVLCVAGLCVAGLCVAGLCVAGLCVAALGATELGVVVLGAVVLGVALLGVEVLGTVVGFGAVEPIGRDEDGGELVGGEFNVLSLSVWVVLCEVCGACAKANIAHAATRVAFVYSLYIHSPSFHARHTMRARDSDV